MDSKNLVDARGLSCPEPAMLAREAILEAKQGTVVVLVDSTTSRNNVTRTAQMNGWIVTAEDEPDGSVRLTLTK
ncbi:MAG: sulfurtransferase TusA family protein [Chloroflexota bacterium]